MTHTIVFEREHNGWGEKGYCIDPLMDKIRTAARSEGWVGMPGFKDWAKEHYNATLRTGKHDDWTSINFPNEQDLDRFKKDLGVE